MKKFLYLMMAAIMAFQMMIVPVEVAAAGSTSVPVKLGTAEGSAGDYVEVELRVDSTVNLTALTAHSFTYDKQKLELVGFTNPSDLVLKKSFIKEDGLSLAENAVALVFGTWLLVIPVVTPMTPKGKICDLKFKIKDNAAPGEVKIGLAATAVNDETEIPAVVTAGKITIKEKAANVPVTGVSLNKSTLTLDKGKTTTLTETVAPSNATNKKVTWTSSNTNVASVDTNGKVKAVAAGTTTITVTTADGNKKATCTVTVKAPAVSPLYGDVNGDKMVNTKDSILLNQYFAGHSVSINKANADVNGDGSVTRADAMILARHVAKWSEYSTLPYKN